MSKIDLTFSVKSLENSERMITNPTAALLVLTITLTFNYSLNSTRNVMLLLAFADAIKFLAPSVNCFLESRSMLKVNMI